MWAHRKVRYNFFFLPQAIAVTAESLVLATSQFEPKGHGLCDKLEAEVSSRGHRVSHSQQVWR